jgi:hypothetical protein
VNVDEPTVVNACTLYLTPPETTCVVVPPDAVLAVNPSTGGVNG